MIIEPFESSLHVGTTQQFTATLVTGQENILTTSDTSLNTVWQSTNTGIATVDATGLVSAVSAGKTDIVAIQGGIRGSTELQVSNKAIAEIILEPAQAVTLTGLTKQFTATARFSDNTTQDITFDANWGSSIISVASINNSGLATGNAVGTTIISAIFAGISSSSSLEIVNTPVDKLVVTPFNNQLHAGGQLQLASYLILIDGSSYDVTNAINWSSSEISIASVGNSIKKTRQSGDPKGLVTAIAQGNAVITAALTLPSGAISASANITVTDPLLTELQVVPAAVSVPLGTTGTFRAFAYYTDGTTEDVTRGSGWFSNDQTVVFVATSGVTAGDAIALGVGQANTTAFFGGQTANSTVTVTSAVITAIQVTPANLRLPVGSSDNYNATAIYSDNSTEDITHQATWVASAPNIVDLIRTGPEAGMVTTLAVGNSNISAIFDGISGSTGIEVTPATITALQIVPAKISVAAGSNGQYVATAFYSDNTSEIVTEQATWFSKDQAILDVVTSGEKAGHYNANAIGSVTVSATYKGTTSNTPATVTAATITSITIIPLQLSLPVGNPGQYRALAVYSDNTALEITHAATWLSSAPNVAQIIPTGENAGRLATLAEGSSTISASLDGTTGSTSLTVSAAVITSLQVTPADVSVPAGSSGPYHATAYYSDNSSEDVTRQTTWQSSNTTVATIIPIGETAGIVTTTQAGSTTISAGFGGETATTPLTVTAAVLTSIEVFPANKSTPNGINVQYRATGIYSDGSNVDLTNNVAWQSSNQSIATINSGGFTDTLSVGASTISASMGAVTSNATLTVTAAVATNLAVIPFAGNGHPGDTGQFQAIAYYSDNTASDATQASTWTSSNSSVVVVVPGGAKAGFAAAVGVGSADVIARFAGLSASTSVEVTAAVLETIQVTPVNNSISKGLTVQYSATGLYSDGSSSDLTSTVTWASGNTAIATIDSGGLATAINTGSTSISASQANVSASTNLSVTAATITNLVVLPFSTEAPVGSSNQLIAVAYYTDGKAENVTRLSTWTSANASVATVIPSGKLAGYVTAAGIGNTTITATYDGQSATSLINVTAAVLTQINVFPFTKSVAQGIEVQYLATGIYSDGSNTDLTDEATWISSNIAVAVVDLQGKALAIGVGTTTISASLDSVTSNASLVVTDAVVVGMQILPAQARLHAGTEKQLTAQALFSNGATEDVTSQATWLSDSTSTATVLNGENGGLVETHAAGIAIITAAFGNTTGSTVSVFQLTTSTIIVTAPILDSIQVQPVNKNVPAGTFEQYFAYAIYSDGTTEDVTSVADWQSDNLNIATIGLDGLLRGESVGSVFVSAGFGNLIGSTTVNVTNAIISNIVITPQGGSVPLGINGPLTATAVYSDDNSLDVTRLATWSSSAPAVIRVVTTGENAGQAQSLSTGTSTISAHYDGLTASTDFTVTAAVLVSISVDPANTSVAKGVNLQYTATGVYTDGSNSDLSNAVNWQSATPTVATISSSGLAESILEGSTQIRATSAAITGTAELAVTAATLTTLTIVAPEISMPVGTDMHLNAVAIYSDNSTQVVTRQSSWVSNMPSIVSVVATGENAGFAQALSVGGPATITASLEYTGGSKTATSPITVTAATLVDIQISPPNETVPSGLDVQYVAIGIYSDDDTQDISNEVVWSTSNPALVSIDQSGLASTSETLTGSTDIVTNFGGFTPSTPLNVIAIAPDRLEISPKNSEIANLTTVQYAATAILNNGDSFDVTNLATWTSSIAAVATISNQADSRGLAHANAAGTTDITAQIIHNGTTYADTGDLLVTPAVIDHIVVSSEETTILLGTTTQFFAQAVYEGGATDDITDTATWTTSDAAIAIVSNFPGTKGLTIATGVGTATITARFENFTDSQPLEVITANLSALVIEPLESTIALGGDVQYTATATLDTGDEIDVTALVVWNSNPTGVAVISPLGNATSVSAGITTISATLNGFNASTNLTVTDGAIIVVTITPLEQKIAKDSELQFEAQVLIDGVPIEDATKEVDWSTTNCIDKNGVPLADDDCDDVVEISNKKKEKGLASAEDEGSVTVVGTYTHESTGIYTSYTASTGLEVIDLDDFPLVLDITPKNASVEEKKHLRYTLTGTWDTGDGFIVQDLTKSDDTSWDTDDDDIATIKNDGSKKGEAKGEDPGTTSIEAEFNGTGAAPTFITVQ